MLSKQIKQMRTLFLVSFILILSSGNVHGYKFIVERFTRMDNDIDARVNQKKDQNGEVCALIKVRTDIKNLKFDATNGIQANVDYIDGDYWVYVSTGEKKLKIMIEGGGITTLDTIFPERILPSTVYLMVLSSDYKPYDSDANLINVRFLFNQNSVYTSLDKTAPSKSIENNTVFKLPKKNGEYDFQFSKEGYNDVQRKIKIDKDTTINIEMEEGNRGRKFEVPGIISISSDPNVADVYLNDQQVGKTFYQEQLPPGTYTLTIRKSLYHSYTGTFKILSEENKQLPLVKLNPKFGELQINSALPETEIYVDDKPYGFAPVLISQIESGEHSIKAERKLYHSETKKVVLLDSENKQINFDLKQAFGSLSILSEPENAEVFIDGKKVGVTPYIDEQIVSGKYRVVLKKELYNDYEESIIVQDNEHSKKNLLMNRNYGTISITSSGSRIFINDIQVGQNFYSQKVTAGNFKIKITKDRHQTIEKNVFIGVGKDSVLVLNPEPIMASIAVLSTPEATKGSQIFINGSNTGKLTPSILPLMIGDYKIALRHDGYLDASQDVSLSENENRKITIPMRSYVGSNMQKMNRWKKSKWTSFGLLVVDAAVAGFFNYRANSSYMNYNKSTNSSDASYYRNQTIKNDQMTYLTIGAGIIPLSWFIVSSFKKNRYRKMIGPTIPNIPKREITPEIKRKIDLNSDKMEQELQEEIKINNKN
jgi:hypothetical protein